MKFTIITTCLNAGTTIKDTIESVLNQKGDIDLEYIITDAGSTDDTLEIIKSFNDPRLRLINATGSSQSEGFNIGIDNATGDIISFLNADDKYFEDTLIRVSKEFEKSNEFKWAFGSTRIVDSKGNEKMKFVKRYKNFLANHYSYNLLLLENFVPHPSVFLKIELFQEFGQYTDTEKYAMDYDLWLRIGKKYRPKFINKDLSIFLRDDNTKSNTGYLKQMKDDRDLGIKYAKKHTRPYLIPLKYLSYLKTIFIYKLIN